MQILVQPEARELGDIHRAVVAIVFILNDPVFQDLEGPVEMASGAVPAASRFADGIALIHLLAALDFNFREMCQDASAFAVINDQMQAVVIGSVIFHRRDSIVWRIDLRTIHGFKIDTVVPLHPKGRVAVGVLAEALGNEGNAWERAEDHGVECTASVKTTIRLL